MDQIIWTDRLSTGNERLDKQRRDLIDKLRSLEEAIRTGECTEVLQNTFWILDFYTSDHFQDEEAEMDRLRCPQAELNRRGHARFLFSIATLNGRLLGEGPSEHLALDVHHELAEWFVHHILLIDVRMARTAMRVG